MSRILNFSSKIALLAAAVAAVVLLMTYHTSQNRTVEQASPGRTVEISYDFSVVDIPEHAGAIRVWAPVPQENDQQKLHGMAVAGGRPWRIVDEPEFGNRFIILDLNGASLPQSRQADFSIKFRITRYAVSPVGLRAPAWPVMHDQPAYYLAAERLIPIDGKIAAEAQRVAGQQHDALKQARLLYDNIVTTVRYDKSGEGWGRGDALYACDVRRGNCTDFHSLFISQTRALGIPSRFIMGLPLPEGKTEGTIPGYHCWCEFYLREKGWCPVDASEASKFPQKKEQFFCGLDEHRVAFTTGRNIKLPGSAAEPANYVIYPYAEVDGRPHDGVRTTFSFRDCPADAGI